MRLRINRKRALRQLLWIPCILVCISALFAPETAGVASRLLSDRTVYWGQHRIRIPLNWVIDHNEDADFSAMTAPGIGRIGFQRYWRCEVPVSDLGFFPIRYPEVYFEKNVPSGTDTILATHSFPLGNESLNCWDLVEHNRFVGPRPQDPSMALIRCSSDSEHFYAYFNGWRGDTAAFYNTLLGLNEPRQFSYLG